MTLNGASESLVVLALPRRTKGGRASCQVSVCTRYPPTRTRRVAVPLVDVKRCGWSVNPEIAGRASPMARLPPLCALVMEF